MTAEQPFTNGLTAKEMWVRVDAKLDAVLAKQGHYDVELALLNARVTENRSDLDSAAKTLVIITENQNIIGARQKATAIIVAAVVIVSNLVAAFVVRVW